MSNVEKDQEKDKEAFIQKLVKVLAPREN